MSVTIKPVGDRLLVKLVRLSEKKVGSTVLTLANDVKKKYQPECSKALVIAGGSDVPAGIGSGALVLIRSDAGIGLTSDIVETGEARLYRVIEYPEVLAILEEAAEISDANQVCNQLEVA
jgi:hypothetical protein